MPPGIAGASGRLVSGKSGISCPTHFPWAWSHKIHFFRSLKGRPAVRRPGPATGQMSSLDLGRVGDPECRQILAGRGEHATVDPRCTRGRAVILQLVVPGEMLVRKPAVVSVDLP